MRRLSAILLALIAVCAPAGAARATFSMSDIVNWTGSGPNSAALVIDWNDDRAPDSLAWGFRWSGTATGMDMIQAVAAADPWLFLDVRNIGFGPVVFGIACDADQSGNALDFTGPFDESATTDAPDHLREGFYVSGYWRYFNGATTGTSLPSWNGSGSGALTRALSDGSWDGWSYTTDLVTFDGPAPETPVASVPEPASLFYAGCGIALLAGRRRRSTG
jgi:hypothetical protein